MVSTGTRLFTYIVVLFLLCTAVFVAFQYQREKHYKRALVATQLQEYNNHLAESLLHSATTDTAAYCAAFLQRHSVPALAVVVLRQDSTVLFSHEQTTGQQFSVTTVVSAPPIVIRSALPYDVRLSEVLATDKTYLVVAASTLLLLIAILYRYTRRLGRNISALQHFAETLDSGKPYYTALGTFSADELGAIAEEIVKIHLRLEETKKEQERLKRELTHNISHELKTPTAIIRGYLETILDDSTLSAEAQRTFLTRCHRQVERLSALLADLSLLNKMDEYDSTQQVFEDVDVYSIIQQVVHDRQETAQQQQMTIVVNVPSPCVVHGDKTLLHSIFSNLVDNALRYAGEKTTLTITITDDGNHWQCTVADNGRGVSEKHLPRLSERFYRGDEGRTRNDGGTGLGLSIVKNAVRLHGGRLTLSPTFPTTPAGLTATFPLPRP